MRIKSIKDQVFRQTGNITPLDFKKLNAFQIIRQRLSIRNLTFVFFMRVDSNQFAFLKMTFDVGTFECLRIVNDVLVVFRAHVMSFLVVNYFANVV